MGSRLVFLDSRMSKNYKSLNLAVSKFYQSTQNVEALSNITLIQVGESSGLQCSSGVCREEKHYLMCQLMSVILSKDTDLQTALIQNHVSCNI